MLYLYSLKKILVINLYEDLEKNIYIIILNIMKFILISKNDIARKLNISVRQITNIIKWTSWFNKKHSKWTLEFYKQKRQEIDDFIRYIENNEQSKLW